MSSKSKLTKITPVIVTYNSSEHIGNLLDSLLTQRELIDKIVVVENNSPDKIETAKTIYSYSKTYKNLIEFHNLSKNLGFGASCNLGSRHVKTEYILFINPDTTVMHNSLTTLIQHAMETKSDIIGGKCIKEDGSLHRTVVRKPNLLVALFEFSNLGKLFNTLVGSDYFYYTDKKINTQKVDIKVDAVSGAYLMIKTISFKKLAGFDDNFFMYLEDVDLGVRANSAGMKVLYCPHSVINHIGGASSKNLYRIRHSAWYSSRKYYFKKHESLGVNIFIQMLYIAEEFMLKVRTKL